MRELQFEGMQSNKKFQVPKNQFSLAKNLKFQ